MKFRIACFVVMAVTIPANIVGLVFYAHNWVDRAVYAFAIVAIALLLAYNRDLISRDRPAKETSDDR